MDDVVISAESSAERTISTIVCSGSCCNVYRTAGSSDFDIFLEIQYASCVFGLALKS